jgi:hypothetical protein
MQINQYVKIGESFDKQLCDRIFDINNYLVQSKDFHYYCYYYDNDNEKYKRGVIIKVKKSNQIVAGWTLFEQKKKN